jgi:cyclase
MLKTRIVGVLVVKGGIVVQSIGFARYLPVGSVAIAVEYLNRWGIDEIVLLDIDATAQGRPPQFDAIREYSKFCQVPLTVGGGIGTVADMERLVHSGADRIAINAAALENPTLIAEGARHLGSQCIVVSIDARRQQNGEYRVYSHSGTRATPYDALTCAKRAEDAGAGEIFLTSIDRDGSKQGYDLDLLGTVAAGVSVPVVVCGGAGHPRHLQEAAGTGVSGVAAANFYHYTEHSVIVAKSYLKAAGANVRLDSYVTYEGFRFDDDGRAAKIDDAALDKLRFEVIPEEVI